jgi:hypothetical protein
MQYRGQPDWQSCIFCTNKTYKKDGKLHKVESEERMNNILEAARHNLDHEIEFIISDTNLRNAVSWSEVFQFTFSLGVFNK